MTALADALRRMTTSARMDAGLLGEALDSGEVLAPLFDEVIRLEATVRRDRSPAPSVVAEARRRWVTSEGRLDDLTAREIRALCGESEIATQPAFVRALATIPDLPARRQWLERLADSYLATWRTMAEPERLEALLRTSIDGFSGRSATIARYRQGGDHLFSSQAPLWLATRVLDDRRTVASVLDEWRVPVAGGLGQATANATLDVWTERFQRAKHTARGAEAFDWFRLLTEEILVSPTLDPARVGRALSTLILWDQTQEDESMRVPLEAFLLADPRFGDPRLRKNHWDMVEAAARQRVIAWLSRKDLVFFFDFVIRYDPHGRKDFWLRYIDQVVDSRVALSELDAWRLRNEVKEKVSYSIATAGNDTSAFLMRFKGTQDILCVEFSKSGNAMYVHDMDKFVQWNGGIRQSRFHVRNDLKSFASATTKFDHRGNWEADVRAFLSRTGIRRR